MPYGKCTQCDTVTHYSVDNLSEWIEKIKILFPLYKFPELAPTICFACWRKNRHQATDTFTYFVSSERSEL